MQAASLEQIGVLRTPFAEKFGIPRQPNLAAVQGRLEFYPPYNDPAAILGMEQASHVWVLWQFHASPDPKGDSWQPSVRPPRLGGNQRMGVFATRSGFRPNRIGLSVCKLDAVAADGSLQLSGVDMLDGTPVLDVKPYLPYADALPQARLDWAMQAPKVLPVEWSEDLDVSALDELARGMIESVLAQDPRPAYHTSAREYGVSLGGWNVRFVVNPQGVLITDLQVKGQDHR